MCVNKCVDKQLSHSIIIESLGVPGVLCHPKILANQLTLSQPGGQIMPIYVITTGPPGFSDLPTALNYTTMHF